MQKTKGFSLFEFLITLVIAIIMVAIAIPSQRYFLQKSQDANLRSQLVQAIEMAKNEAITRGEPVTLCKSNDAKSCQGTWEKGYMIHSLEKVLFVFQTPPAKGVIHWRAFPKNQETVQFLPTGFTNTENGTFWYCREHASAPSWAIVISKTGRVRVEESVQGELKCS